MEAFLIDEWLGREEAIPIADEASVSVAREAAREVAAAQGLGDLEGARLATIASELAHNQLAHARRGQLAVIAIARGELRGVEIVAADEGEGIADPTRAFAGEPRITGSLGVGLAAVREHAHELDVDVRLREGTCIRARVFAGEPPRRREVGVFGRPYHDEPRSGDHACFCRDDDERLLVGLCDGLGHGTPARAASSTAMKVFINHRAGSPQEIIEACHRNLGPTRGAVMAVVAIGESSARFELAAVGNITVELVQPRSSRRFGASSFVLGATQRGWRPHLETTALEAGETLLMYSDGIASRASIAEDLALLREHPLIIAQQIVERFGRDTDDVLVLVAK